MCSFLHSAFLRFRIPAFLHSGFVYVVAEPPVPRMARLTRLRISGIL
jgi:hypothetical protein